MISGFILTIGRSGQTYSYTVSTPQLSQEEKEGVGRTLLQIAKRLVQESLANSTSLEVVFALM